MIEAIINGLTFIAMTVTMFFTAPKHVRNHNTAGVIYEVAFCAFCLWILTRHGFYR